LIGLTAHIERSRKRDSEASKDHCRRRRRGLELAAKLGAKYGRKRHDIILVERNRTHIWKPLLHEVATGSLDANLDEVGYRSHCHRWGYRFFHGALESIDRKSRQI